MHKTGSHHLSSGGGKLAQRMHATPVAYTYTIMNFEIGMRNIWCETRCNVLEYHGIILWLECGFVE